jgi:endonuclease/exonuclease/phosphatase family metal-dependent hydrolase
MQAQVLAGPDWIGGVAATAPLILLGDFNSLPGSAPCRLLARHLRDIRTLVTPAPGLRTFPTRYPLLALDHIFVSDRFQVTSVTVLQNEKTRVASDHYPLVADLHWARAAGTR